MSQRAYDVACRVLGQAGHLAAPRSQGRSSRDLPTGQHAQRCTECDLITERPLRVHSLVCQRCHYEKDLPPRVRVRRDADRSRRRCPECHIVHLVYSVRLLCPECKAETQPVAVARCRCGELVPDYETPEHAAECQA